MYTEEEFLPISALQHLLYCERQCALIHIERVWSENRLTVEGNHLHDRVDEGGQEKRKTMRSEYRVPLHSFHLGLTGYADLVEFRNLSQESEPAPQPIFDEEQVYPVEFKHGVEKQSDIDRVQLCAQAMCLEEMLHTTIPTGALFYAKVHRRSIVEFDERLRNLTEETAEKLHRLIENGVTPVVAYSKKCHHCSLLELCMPPKTIKPKKASNYIRKIIAEIGKHETHP